MDMIQFLERWGYPTFIGMVGIFLLVVGVGVLFFCQKTWNLGELNVKRRGHQPRRILRREDPGDFRYAIMENTALGAAALVGAMVALRLAISLWP